MPDNANTAREFRATLKTALFSGAMMLACSSTNASTDKLRARSALDLNCSSENIRIEPVGERTMGVSGCGHRATYIESCSTPNAYKAAECNWVFHSDSRQPTPIATTPYGVPNSPPAQAPFPPPTAPAPTPTQPTYAFQPVEARFPPTQAYVIAQMQPRPLELEYQKGMPAPVGYRLEEYRSMGLIVSGATTLGALYAISLTAGAEQKFAAGYGWLALPVVGPFGWLAARKAPSCSLDTYAESNSFQNCQDKEDNKKALVLLDGVGQTVGAALLITGLAVTRRHWVLVAGQEVMFAPHVSSSSGGLSLFGRF